MINTKLKNREQEKNEESKMKKFMARGIVISSVVLFSIILIIIPSNVYAEKIDIKSFSLEETAILQITNNSNENIDTFRIWLGDDFNFKSFKTENGWAGEKTPQGVVVFKSSKSLVPGETVKFGIKTDKTISGINWKALNNKNEQLGIGKVGLQEIPKVTTNSTINQNTGEGIKSESIFKIIPDKPSPGSTIRVVGESFGANNEFEFYINTEKIGSFVTDENGYFITTMKIPKEQKADRVDFKIKNKSGNEKKISIRLDEKNNRIPEIENIRLSLAGIPEKVQRGDIFEIFGTAKPKSGITIEVIDFNANIINSDTSETNSKGIWESKTITIPLDAPFGKYSIIISDGKNKILKSWNMENDKIIIIEPLKSMFEPGENIKFVGTALPNSSIELILEDPFDNEKMSKIININESGNIEFEYQSKENVDIEGTWKMTAIQGEEKEFIFVGYGEPISIPTIIEFDKLNYKSTETITISFTGIDSDILSTIIIGPSGNIIDEITIKLGIDGKKKHKINLDGYGSGIYNVIVKKSGKETVGLFTVGLQTGSGEIEINTIKNEFMQGEQIILIGKANANSILKTRLIDPNGIEIKTIEIPTDKEGIFTEKSLRIPSEGISGIWKIEISGGENKTSVDISVISIQNITLKVNVVEGIKLDHIGKNIKILVEGANPKSVIQIEISSSQGEMIDNTLSCKTTVDSNCEIPWLIPKNIKSGTYIVKITDNTEIAETTFKIE